MSTPVVNTFSGGMTKDLSFNKFPNDKYFDALNLRVLTDKEGGTISLVSAKGNQIVTSFYGQLYGYCSIRDNLYLFYESDDIGYIVKVNMSNYQFTTIYSYLDLFGGSGYISAVGIYESENIQKIYWSDGSNPLRMINVAANNSGKMPDDFNILPAAPMDPPYITGITTGNLKTCMIQYAYRLYVEHGQQTAFSPVGNSVHITASPDTNTESYYTGSDVDTYTAKGTVVKVYLYSMQFNRIELVAIQYERQEEAPTIRIVEDRAISPNSDLVLTFRDTGQSFGTYSTEEFMILADSSFTCGTLKVKDNILFAANITNESEPSFDFDARAYSFDHLQYLYLWSSDGNELITGHVGGSYYHYKNSSGTPFDRNHTNYILYATYTSLSQIPADFDCVNTFNNITRDDIDATWSQFQMDGTTFGAEGPNVKISIDVNSKPIGNYDSTSKVTSPIDSSTSFRQSYANPLWQSYRSFQPGEIYRLGLVIYRNNRPSPVKWICDIRIPEESQIGPLFTVSNGIIYAKVVSMAVFLRNLPLGGSAAQVVMVKRDIQNSTVLAMGAMYPTLIRSDIPGAANKVQITPTITMPTNVNTSVVKFVAPEIVYGAFTPANGDFFRFKSYFSGHQYYTITYDSTLRGYLIRNGATSILSQSYRIDITPTALTFMTQPEPGDYTSYNVGSGITNLGVMDAGYARTLAGSGIAAALSSSDDSALRTLCNAINNYTNVLFCSYRRPLTNQYGGNSYTARQFNIYTPVPFTGIAINYAFWGIANPAPQYNTTSAYTQSGFISINGDTFVGMFDYLNGSYDTSLSVSNRIMYIHLFPTYSKINLALTSGDIFTRSTDPLAYAAKEKAGAQDAGGDLIYTQNRDYYVYNTVFSQMPSYPYFFPQRDISKNYKYDSRIKFSLKKVAGELKDSWCNFRPGNYKDLDSIYGAINAMLIFKGRLIIFQTSAVATGAVDDRQMVSQDSTFGSVTIGVAQPLQWINYITTEYGCKHPYQAIATDNAIYWIDIRTKELLTLAGDTGVLSLSKSLGMQSWFEVINPDYTMLAYDKKLKEVYIFDNNVITPTTAKSLVFSEYIKAFSGFLTMYTSTLFIQHQEKLLSTIQYNMCNGRSGAPNKQIGLISWNTGNYHSFYDYIRPATLDIIICPANTNSFRMDVTEFSTEVLNGSSVPYHNMTWTTMNVTNSYQNTGTITFVPENNIIKRFKLWRFNMFRDATTDSPSIKDSYARMHLEFTPPDVGWSIKCNDIQSLVTLRRQ